MLCFYNKVKQTFTTATLTEVALKLNSILPLTFERNKKNAKENANEWPIGRDSLLAVGRLGNISQSKPTHKQKR